MAVINQRVMTDPFGALSELLKNKPWLFRQSPEARERAGLPPLPSQLKEVQVPNIPYRPVAQVGPPASLAGPGPAAAQAPAPLPASASAPAPAPPPTPRPSAGAAINPAAAAPVNPFVGPPAPDRSPPTNAIPPSAQPPASPEEKEQRKFGWKAFIQRYKTDPDLRVAMFQTLLGLTQPAGTAAESVGRSLGIGVDTLHALQDRRFTQGQEERRTETTEGRTKLAQEELSQRGKQFEQSLAQQQQELEARREQIKNTQEYQQDQIKLRREELSAGLGQVNQRWTRLRDSLLANPSPELLAIKDDSKRTERAELIAYQMINEAGQDREKFIANYLAGQALMIQSDDPAEYQQEFSRALREARAFADAAGLGSTRYEPASGTSAPPSPPTEPLNLEPGQSITVHNHGQPVTGQVISVNAETVVAEFPPPIGQQTIPRSALGGVRGQP